MPESTGASPALDFDPAVKAFFQKFSWETYMSKHLKYLEIPAYDLESSLAIDQVCHITEQKVSDHDAKCLATALTMMKPENLKQIFLTANDIHDAGCIALAGALPHCPSFELLYLARNYIGNAGLASIAERCSETNMWQLVLTENEAVGDDGVIALADAVTKAPGAAFTKLRWLFLDSTSVGDRGTEALAKAMIVGLPSIERLALQNCKLTNKSLFALGDAIQKGALKKCQYLYVQNNEFDHEGKAALKAAAKPRGIKVHYGWPPPLPGVDYD